MNYSKTIWQFVFFFFFTRHSWQLSRLSDVFILNNVISSDITNNGEEKYAVARVGNLAFHNEAASTASVDQTTGERERCRPACLSQTS